MARPAHRPTKLTPALSDQICAIIRETACSFYTAGLSLGIEWRNLYRWEDWGRDGKQPYADFCQNVMRARAEAELSIVRDLRALARVGESTNGLQWLLDRRYPADYGQKVKIEQQISELTDDQLQAERETLRLRAFADAGCGGDETPVLEAHYAEFEAVSD